MARADSHPLISQLRGNLGESAVLTPADPTHDPRGIFGHKALAMVRPASVAEVAYVVKSCTQAEIAVVPQGGNTGLSGGAVPTSNQPSVILSLTRMGEVESVDASGHTITAQAGASIETVQQAATRANRLFAPDWAARGTATVGGAIATNAGGHNVLRYGTMREQVLGLEAVLADGRVWDGLRALRKDASGYDLKHLFIGSEGTLGVVTRAVLKLHPPISFQQSALAAIPNLDCLTDLLELAQTTTNGAVTALELIPDVGLDRVCQAHGWLRPLPQKTEFLALIKLGSTVPVTDMLGDFLSQASNNSLISDAVVAVTTEQENLLWAIRDGLSPHLFHPHHQISVKLDAAVPIGVMAQYYNQVEAIAQELVPGAQTYAFGHIGDGNLHLYVLPGDHTEPFLARREELQTLIDQATFNLRGTLTAEHGIGQDLQSRIYPQKPPIEWELMGAIKTALDPKNLMNPQKLLPRGLHSQ